MRGAFVLLCLLLSACGQQQSDNLTDTLAADPGRLKVLRAQCAADVPVAAEETCRAAVDASLRRFFSGQAGADEYTSLGELPPIPASFDAPIEEDTP